MRFPPWGVEGWGLADYLMAKPLPCYFTTSRTPPVGRELKTETYLPDTYGPGLWIASISSQGYRRQLSGRAIGTDGYNIIKNNMRAWFYASQ